MISKTLSGTISPGTEARDHGVNRNRVWVNICSGVAWETETGADVWLVELSSFVGTFCLVILGIGDWAIWVSWNQTEKPFHQT